MNIATSASVIRSPHKYKDSREVLWDMAVAMNTELLALREPEYLVSFMLSRLQQADGLPEQLKEEWGEHSVHWNLVSLAGYTLGCHSMRHILGGFRNQFSRHKAFRVPYACSSCLNAAHGRWAWVSLFTVAGSDLYIRLCSMGILSDPRLF